MNDQNQAFYNNYAVNYQKFNDYVRSGGTLVFFACDHGWAGGNNYTNLPGGVQVGDMPNAYNDISDFSHEIIGGAPGSYAALTNGDMYGNYCSHNYFVESSLPASAQVVFRTRGGGALPTFVVYSLGKGKVIASGLTWEFTYDLYAGAGRQFGFGRALPGIFQYAFNISGALATGVGTSVYIDDAYTANNVPLPIKARNDIIDLIGQVSNDDPAQTVHNVDLGFELPNGLELVGVFSRKDAIQYDENAWTRLDEGDGTEQYRLIGQRLTIHGIPVAASGKSREYVVRAHIGANAALSPDYASAYEVLTEVSGAAISTARSEPSKFLVYETANLIVTNRHLLFAAYPNDLDKVRRLLGRLYEEANRVPAVIYFVDKYDRSDTWTGLNPEHTPIITWPIKRSATGCYNATMVYDATEEDCLNSTTLAVDKYIDYWIDNLGGADGSNAKFLLIVGGDEVLPHYRVWDPRAQPISGWSSSLSPVQRAAAEQNYIFSDIIYYDTDGKGWGNGSGLENVYVGRLTGITPDDITGLFERGIDKAAQLRLGRTLGIVTRTEATPGAGVWGAPAPEAYGGWSAVSADGTTNLFDTDNGNKDHLFNLLKDNSIDLLWTYHHGSPFGLSGSHDAGYPKLIQGLDWGKVSADVADALETSLPVWIATACYSGITDGAAGKNYFAANTLQQSFAGLLGATWVTPRAQIPFQGDLAKKLIDGKQSIGQAVKEIKAEFGPKNDLTSARFSYVYYGVPWVRITKSLLAGDGGNQVAAGALESLMQQDDIQPRIMSFQAAGLSLSLTENIGPYRRDALDAFEVIAIDGFDQSGEYDQPVVPLRRVTIDLPLGATLESLALHFDDPVVETALRLPLLERVAHAEYDDVVAYREIPASYGSVPTERYSHYLVQAEGRQVLNVVYSPLVYDPATDTARIFRRVSIDYSLAVPYRGTVQSMTADQDAYEVGQQIIADVAIASLVDAVATFDITARLTSLGGSTLATGSDSLTLDPGASAHAQVPLVIPGSVTDGNYRLEVSAFDGVQEIGSRTLTLSVSSGRVSRFTAPDHVSPGGYVDFQVGLDNLAATAVTGRIDIRVYDHLGNQVAKLPQKLLDVLGAANGETTLRWYPAVQLPLGDYAATLLIDTGSAVFGPISRTIKLMTVPGDLNGDNRVDGADHALIKRALGSCNGAGRFLSAADLDGDGCISYGDYRNWYLLFKAAM